MSEIISKVEDCGRLSIDGVLTKNHDSIQGIVINCGLDCRLGYVIASATASAMVSQVGISDYDSGDVVMIKVTDLMTHTPSTSVIVYQSTSGVKCKTTSAF